VIENIKALLDASKVLGLEVNQEKTMLFNVTLSKDRLKA
jgi:hypothetical protein